MSEPRPPSFKDWRQTIAVQAAKNGAFRQAYAHVNREKELHFVLPQTPRRPGGELTDEDLERVAGGELVIVYIFIAVAGAILLASATVTISEKYDS